MGKIELEIDIDSSSRLRAAGCAGIFELCTFHNYGTATTIKSLPLLLTYNLNLQVDLTCYSSFEQQ